MPKNSSQPTFLTHDEFLEYFSGFLSLLQKVQDQNKELMAEIKKEKGPKGDKGDPGEPGESIKGDPGTPGRDGRDGRDGNDGRDGKDGVDGKDAPPINESRIAENASKIALESLQSQIPTIEQIELDLPKLGEPIRDALELLQGEERLDASAIKGLEDWFAKVENLSRVKTTNMGPGSALGGRIVKYYDLSPFLDGTTKVFSLPAMWRIIAVLGSSFPFNFRPTIDYVYDASAHTITFTNEILASSSLASGQTITIIYSE